MRKSDHFGWKVLVWMLLGVAAGVCSCKNDASKNTDATGIATEQTAEGEGATAEIPAEERKKMEGGLTRIQKLEARYLQVNRKLDSLREEVKNIPASYKKKAAGFSDLEAQLEQFKELSAYMRTELSKMTIQLEQKLNIKKEISDTTKPKLVLMTTAPEALPSNWAEQMGVLDRTVLDFEEGVGKTEGMVSQLKNAKGAAIQLFK